VYKYLSINKGKGGIRFHNLSVFNLSPFDKTSITVHVSTLVAQLFKAKYYSKFNLIESFELPIILNSLKKFNHLVQTNF